jgi:transporter family-2 protein
MSQFNVEKDKNMSPQYFGLALLAGGLLTLQIGVNASLAKYLSSPMGAAALSFTIGAIALIVYFAIIQAPIPSIATFRALPLWTLAGGVLGAIYVAATIICAPHLGSTLLVVLVITGQMIVALVLDHYGLVGFPVREINFMRIIAAVMLIVSVVILVKN